MPSQSASSFLVDLLGSLALPFFDLNEGLRERLKESQLLTFQLRPCFFGYPQVAGNFAKMLRL